jgi:hypothetical protein
MRLGSDPPGVVIAQVASLPLPLFLPLAQQLVPVAVVTVAFSVSVSDRRAQTVGQRKRRGFVHGSAR